LSKDNVKKMEAEEEVPKSVPEYEKLTPKEQYDDPQAGALTSLAKLEARPTWAI
jgi:hypothetical protein